MTKIFRVSDGDTQKFFPDRTSALAFGRSEFKDQNCEVEVEVEMLTLIEGRPAIVACALLEGGYVGDAKVIKLFKPRKR